jgi:chemotaxis signal transduction protein
VSARPGTVEELRRAFDSAFASEPAPPVDRVDLVALRAGDRSYAVRVSDVGAVVPLGAVAAMPCDEPAFLGIAASRGAPVAVYDLAALLGDGAVRAPRWVLLTAGADRVAFAFDEIEEYLRVPREQLVAAQPPELAAAGPSELLRAGARQRPVVSLGQLVKRLEERLGLPRKG